MADVKIQKITPGLKNLKKRCMMAYTTWDFVEPRQTRREMKNK